MMRTGIDFISSNYPGGKWFQFHNFTFGISYASMGTSWKDLTPTIVEDLDAYHIDCVLVYEQEAQPKGGFDEGRKAAQRVRALKSPLHMPVNRSAYYAFDYDPPDSDFPILDTYLRGANLETELPGCYSSGAYLLHALTIGIISRAWLSCSTGYRGYQAAIDSNLMSLTQECGGPIDGWDVDVDTAHVDDFGQWRPNQPWHPQQTNPSDDPLDKAGLVMTTTPYAISACTRIGHLPQHWVLHDDGGVFSFDGAPFYGSYPGLRPQNREGTRHFVQIECDADGNGYTLYADDGAYYHFR